MKSRRVTTLTKYITPFNVYIFDVSLFAGYSTITDNVPMGVTCITFSTNNNTHFK